jgi:hypothetical protein
MQTYSEGVYDSTFKGGGMKLFFKDNLKPILEKA